MKRDTSGYIIEINKLFHIVQLPAEYQISFNSQEAVKWSNHYLAQLRKGDASMLLKELNLYTWIKIKIFQAV